MSTKKPQNQFLNLTQDLMFKIYFSKDKQILLSLLKTFLPLPHGKTIKDISFLEIKEQTTHSTKKESYRKQGENAPLMQKKEQRLTIMDSSLYPNIATNKQIVMDLRVQLNTGEKINVEMQSISKKGFLNRVLFYWARLYTDNLRKAEDYHHLCPAYSLIFTDFSVFKHKDKIGFKNETHSEDETHYEEQQTLSIISEKRPSGHQNLKACTPKADQYKTTDISNIITSFSLRSDKKPHFVLNDQLKIVFVELSKFNTSSNNINLPNIFDFQKLWCYLLKRSKNISPRECELLSKKGDDMKRAVEHLQDLSQDEEVRRWEEAREKFIRDQRAEKAYAFDEGLEKGIEKGRAEGIQQGRAEGMEKGRAEGRQEEQRAVALNILRKNLDISFISEITGLSEEEIKKLQEKYKK